MLKSILKVTVIGLGAAVLGVILEIGTLILLAEILGNSMSERLGITPRDTQKTCVVTR